MKLSFKANNIIIFICSIFIPGLRHIYFRKVYKGLLLFLSGLILFCFVFFALYKSFYGLMSSIFFLLFFNITVLTRASKNRDKNDVKIFSSYLLTGIYLFILTPLFFLKISPLKLYQAESSSMVPALLPGDIFLVDTKYYDDTLPARKEIVVFGVDETKNVKFVKRIIGLPEERIKCNGNKVYVDEKILSEKYLNAISELSGSNINLNYLIPENSVFLMGDNRINSFDSRHFKGVHMSALCGKALYVLWSDQKNRIGKNL